MNFIRKYTNRLFFGAACLFLFACKSKSVNNTSSTDSEGYDKGNLNDNYDWTGTYELKDKDITYTLKLHKRSVDGSYEMQFYNNTKNADLLKSSIYDAKDISNTIIIRFLNNFHMDAKPLGFNSGDTLFILEHLSNEKDSTSWKKLTPATNGLHFTKVNNTY